VSGNFSWLSGHYIKIRNAEDYLWNDDVFSIESQDYPHNPSDYNIYDIENRFDEPIEPYLMVINHFNCSLNLTVPYQYSQMQNKLQDIANLTRQRFICEYCNYRVKFIKKSHYFLKFCLNYKLKIIVTHFNR
jgi:hypothetical protein